MGIDLGMRTVMRMTESQYRKLVGEKPVKKKRNVGRDPYDPELLAEMREHNRNAHWLWQWDEERGAHTCACHGKTVEELSAETHK